MKNKFIYSVATPLLIPHSKVGRTYESDSEKLSHVPETAWTLPLIGKWRPHPKPRKKV